MMSLENFKQAIQDLKSRGFDFDEA
jgi:hypothetical protein